jgi:hypothetical protein
LRSLATPSPASASFSFEVFAMSFLNICSAAHRTYRMPVRFQLSVKNLRRLNDRVLKLFNDLLVCSAMSSTNHELQVSEISLVQLLLHAHVDRWRGLCSWKMRNPRRPSFLLDSRQFYAPSTVSQEHSAESELRRVCRVAAIWWLSSRDRSVASELSRFTLN